MYIEGEDASVVFLASSLSGGVPTLSDVFVPEIPFANYVSVVVHSNGSVSEACGRIAAVFRHAELPGVRGTADTAGSADHVSYFPFGSENFACLFHERCAVVCHDRTGKIFRC